MDARRLKVLLVEDNEDDYIIVRELFREIEAVSFDLIWATEPDEGLQLIELENPDVCLVDYRLGERTGLDLLREVRQRGWQVPVILLTGQGDHEIDVQAMAAGASDYLVKDQLHAEWLERAIRHALERQRHEEVIRESEERFRLLVEGVRDYGIFMLSPTGLVTIWNAGAERITGYDSEHILGQHFSCFYTPEDVQAGKLESALKIAVEEGRSEDEGWCVRQDGSRFWANTVITALRNADGHLRGFARITRDITIAKRAEETLRAKDEEVRSTSQQLWQTAKLATMGELVASIAHELNNPMATVTLHLEALLMELPEDAPQRKPLAIVEGEIERMTNLVAHLLQFSRRSQQQVSTLNVEEEIEKTLELVQFYLRNRSVSVKREFAADVPPVQADCQQMRQLFLNLFTNASDAMPQGGTLTLRVRREGDLVITEVSDDGQGIEPENMAKVLEPFFTTKPEGKGTGLGLAICRRIVNEHGGAFDIESEVGRGTTVRISLPLADHRLLQDDSQIE